MLKFNQNSACLKKGKHERQCDRRQLNKKNKNHMQSKEGKETHHCTFFSLLLKSIKFETKMKQSIENNMCMLLRRSVQRNKNNARQMLNKMSLCSLA